MQRMPPAGAVLIEIGGGETPHRPSYLHLDVRPVPGIDVVSDAKHLPIASAIADEIYAAHVIEHLPYAEGRGFLGEVSRVLKIGGRFELSCPDLARVIGIYRTVPDLAHDVGRVDSLRSILYGAQTNKFDFHRSGYNFRLLSHELAKVGLTSIRKLSPGTEFHFSQRERREVRMLYEMHVEALKAKEKEPVGLQAERGEESEPGNRYLITEIAIRNTEIGRLEAERSGLNSRIETLEAERSRLIEQLNRAKKELEEIHHSFGYKFMRLYAHHIDRSFPDGTSRGELRKIVTASLRLMMEGGFRAFSSKATEKTKRTLLRRTRPLQTTQEAKMRSVAPNAVSDEDLARDLKEFLSDHDATLEFPVHKEPLVSIVVVTYNKALYTYECLRSLLADPLPEHEVIIVDNASSDETPWLLRKTANAIIIRNAENQFFARACNQGARSARGKYLLFLNNDAFVHPGCISSLLETMDSAPNLGAAGAKIIWRNGRLQEAGSIIWWDGSTQAYGRGDDPTKPEYCSTRDVDYCSAACIIVRRDAFEKLGGFDEAFKPAYYEDADLCMRLWSAGYRVVYQPLAVATHIEFAGSSSGTATELMKKNRLVFRAKHKKALEKQLPFFAENVPRARTRNN